LRPDGYPQHECGEVWKMSLGSPTEKCESAALKRAALSEIRNRNCTFSHWLNPRVGGGVSQILRTSAILGEVRNPKGTPLLFLFVLIYI